MFVCVDGVDYPLMWDQKRDEANLQVNFGAKWSRTGRIALFWIGGPIAAMFFMALGK